MKMEMLLRPVRVTDPETQMLDQISRWLKKPGWREWLSVWFSSAYSGVKSGAVARSNCPKFSITKK